MAQLIKLNVVATTTSKYNNKIEIVFDELIDGFEVKNSVKTAKKVDHVLLESAYLKKVLHRENPIFHDVADGCSNEDVARIILGCQLTLKRQFVAMGEAHPTMGTIATNDQYATIIIELRLGAAGYQWLQYMDVLKTAKELGSTDIESVIKYKNNYRDEANKLFFYAKKLSSKVAADVETVDDDVYNPTTDTEDAPAEPKAPSKSRKARKTSKADKADEASK